MAMTIGLRGLDLIRSAEGYLKPVEGGGCKAYRCPAGVWTIGWGCTEGVAEGMTWTKTQAEEGLLRELAKHEAAVTRAVTVPMTQHQFDALVSFSYNVGAAGMAKSTVVRKFNAGDLDGASQAFVLWNKAGGQVLRGLTIRRTREAALFMRPMDGDEPSMPQRVEQRPEPPTRTTVAGIATTATAAATTALTTFEPGAATAALTTWKTFGTSVADAVAWAGQSGRVGLAVAVGGGVFVVAKYLVSLRSPS